jgi:hypothetical protein
MTIIGFKAAQAKVSFTNLALVFSKFLVNTTNIVKAFFDKVFGGAIQISAAGGSEAHRR